MVGSDTRQESLEEGGLMPIILMGAIKSGLTGNREQRQEAESVVGLPAEQRCGSDQTEQTKVRSTGHGGVFL